MVTVGGYAGLPCSVAAILLRVPLVVVSCDAVAGSFEPARGALRPQVRGRVRGDLTAEPGRDRGTAAQGGPRHATAPRRGAARPARALGVPAGRFLLAVEGGSLGARRLNDAALGLAKSWASRDDVTIYHVAGERNLASVKREAAAGSASARRPRRTAGLDYRLVGYERQMPALLAACDFAVCRAGASTVAELAAIGTPERPRARCPARRTTTRHATPRR